MGHTRIPVPGTGIPVPRAGALADEQEFRFPGPEHWLMNKNTGSPYEDSAE